MEITDPRIPLHLLPPGSRATVIKDKAGKYLELPSIVTEDKRVISRWTLSHEDKMAIIRGEDIFVTILTGGYQIQPFKLEVGMKGWLDEI